MKIKILLAIIFIQSIIIIFLFLRGNPVNDNDREIARVYADGSKWIRTFYYKSKFIKNEGMFKDDTTRHGLIRLYNPDGSLNWEANYTEGKLNGLVRDFHSNNTNHNYMKFEGVMLNGKKIGLWKFFESNGNPHSIEIFDSLGNIKYDVHFDEFGKVKRDKYH